MTGSYYSTHVTFVFSKGEGVAYRGRVLVELKVVPQGIARPVRQVMPKEDEALIEVTHCISFTWTDENHAYM